jgi:hypothetical protein
LSSGSMLPDTLASRSTSAPASSTPR